MHLEIITEITGLPVGMEALFAQLGDTAAVQEGVGSPLQVGLVITDDEGIAIINREQRGKEAPTDVLSFPSVTFPMGQTAGKHAARLRQEYVPETGCMHLGDIVISLPRAMEQAQTYGHALTRELGFLFTHGVLHLMGYDHETDAQRAQMRAMEESIMKQAGISRDLTDEDFALVQCAREAMQRAYVPYSKYKVGACVRTTDGKLFKGCNVENASYGMTICAERNAMTTAVTEGMQGLEAIAIASEGSMPYPCGACRQFMREFARDMRIIVANEEHIQVTTLGALLPDSFGPESLKGVDA